MATRKTEPRPHIRPHVRRQPVRVEDDKLDRKDAEIVHSRLQAREETLTLDDGDFGGDPYNSTGKFTVVKIDRTRS